MPSQVDAAVAYPIGEPSVLTFQDLIIEVAYKLGIASYGSTGTDAPSVPTDTHDLVMCKRIVNKAVRMFIHDGPRPNGWRWLNPIAQVDLWPQINADPTGNVYVTSTGYNSTSNLTTLTLTTPIAVPSTSTSIPTFYPSMELRNIWLGGNPPQMTPGWNQPVLGTSTSTTGTGYVVAAFLSPSQIQIYGPISSTIASTSTQPIQFSMVTLGDYTLPTNFGGQYVGAITYVQNTNRGMILSWTTESAIRSRRQNYNIESGTPYEAAVRLIPTPQYSQLHQTLSASTMTFPRWRWELMTWRIPSEFLHVIFPYTLHFQDMTSLTDLTPAPFGHDESIKAACLAVAEKEAEDTLGGPDWKYYHDYCLPNSYRVDAASAPHSLGYFGNPTAKKNAVTPIRTFRDQWYQRPTVPVFP